MTNELLQNAKSGNMTAMNDLLQQSRRYACSVAYFYVSQRPTRGFDAEDAVQNAMMEVFRDLHACKATTWADYLSWLSCVTRNCCYKLVVKTNAKKRAANRTVALPVLADPDRAYDTGAFNVPGSDPLPENTLIADETRQQLLRLARGLGEIERNVCELMIEGCEPSEIADLLQLPVRRVYNAAKRFRAHASLLVNSQ
jgi:RNA polymerase sigma factor (sigma-70 family)